MKKKELKPNCDCIENIIYGYNPFINEENNTPYCRWCGENFKNK